MGSSRLGPRLLGLGPRVLGSTVWGDYRNNGASNRTGAGFYTVRETPCKL